MNVSSTETKRLKNKNGLRNAAFFDLNLKPGGVFICLIQSVQDPYKYSVYKWLKLVSEKVILVCLTPAIYPPFN